jgi:hypothetical protein
MRANELLSAIDLPNGAIACYIVKVDGRVPALVDILRLFRIYERTIIPFFIFKNKGSKDDQFGHGLLVMSSRADGDLLLENIGFR